MVRIDSLGRFIVSTRNQSLIQVFAESGEFLHTVGRSGQAPGEYQSPVATPSATGGVVVVDPLQGRVTHLGAAFEVVATNAFALSGLSDLIQLPDATLIAAAVVRERGEFGLPLHALSPNGESILRSFGGPDQAIRRTQVVTLRRVISPPTEVGSFWSLRGTQYQLEEWDSSGQLLRTINRNVEWFEPWFEPPARNAREQAPPPSPIGVYQDSEGLLWTLVHVADENWRPLPPGDVTEGGATITTMQQRNRLHDTIIEVIDPGLRRLVSSLRLDAYLRGFAGRGIVYSYVEDELGQHPRFVLHQLELVYNQ